MTKIYNVELPCGCLVAEGTFDEDGNSNGDVGLLPCCAEYGDEKAKELCRKSNREYFDKVIRMDEKKLKEEESEFPLKDTARIYVEVIIPEKGKKDTILRNRKMVGMFSKLRSPKIGLLVTLDLVAEEMKEYINKNI